MLPVHRFEDVFDEVTHAARQVYEVAKDQSEDGDDKCTTQYASYAEENAALEIHPVDLRLRTIEIIEELFHDILTRTAFVVTLDARCRPLEDPSSLLSHTLFLEAVLGTFDGSVDSLLGAVFQFFRFSLGVIQQFAGFL